jgi:para-aminobenzoate synthetase / 4-amino-4-deoxychorismate lyase
MKRREEVQLHAFTFSCLQEEIAAYSPADVLPALARVAAATADGLHAAGFVSYEAAAGLGTGLTSQAANDFPLLWFGLFSERVPALPQQFTNHLPHPACATSDWTTSLSSSRHARAVMLIKELIAAGHTYQVNFTMRLRFQFSGSPEALYAELCRSQPTPYSAFIDTGRFQVLSASPELFFKVKDGMLTTRPMKGTAERGRWWQEDEAAKMQLRENPKERAENLMIVDLLRNDMGMVSATGSVQVRSLFDVESLGTVHQMTSTIESRLREGVGIVDLFRALFPCGSVTGAPKRRTMEIIAALEDSPRGVYTGCIGYISPGGEALFSVAIRTIAIDETGRGELGIGSGITFDSQADAEYAECLAKGRFAQQEPREFQLIESLLFEEGTGYFLLERHLERLARSAAYFAFPLEPGAVRKALAKIATPLAGRHKVRLLLSRQGEIVCEAAPIGAESGETELTAAFAGRTVDSADPFLYHKTTCRGLYAEEAALRPDCADVLFVNERGEVTEGAVSNIVARIGGELVTPPLASGLLPGVFREELLATGVIRERVIRREELEMAEEVHLVNSVRKWRRVKLCA